MKGRYFGRMLFTSLTVLLFLFLIRRFYVENNVAGLWTRQSYFQFQKDDRLHQDVEIWTKPWKVNNETWGKLKTTLGEVDIMIYPEPMDKVVSGNILVNGTWEPGELLGVERLFQCDPQLGLIDIGANIGLYVLLGAAYKRHVVAVEPSMDNLGRLYASVQKNDFQRYVTLVHNAVSNRYTSMELSANPWNRGNTVIRDANDPNFHVPGEFEVADRVNVGTVKTILMDDLLPVVRFTRGILKIDIEGAEQLAFQFSHNFLTLLDIPYIFMEWLWIKHDAPQAKRMFTFFTSRGYRPYQNAHLNIKLNNDYLNWPTDVFWVNLDKTGPCKESIQRWEREDLRAPVPKQANQQGYLPPDVVDRLRMNEVQKTFGAASGIAQNRPDLFVRQLNPESSESETENVQATKIARRVIGAADRAIDQGLVDSQSGKIQN